MDYEELKNKIKMDLKGNSLSIPQLCNRYNLQDDFDVNVAINELVLEGTIKRNGAKPIFREDGGAIYLGLYTGIE